MVDSDAAVGGKRAGDEGGGGGEGAIRERGGGAACDGGVSDEPVAAEVVAVGNDLRSSASVMSSGEKERERTSWFRVRFISTLKARKRAFERADVPF